MKLISLERLTSFSQKMINKLNGKLESNLGAENSGKSLMVDQDGNVTASLEFDQSLTKQGCMADAKIVGDEINQLKPFVFGTVTDDGEGNVVISGFDISTDSTTN